MYGAIGVIDWGKGRGHVGFVESINANGSVNLLGGNQSDSVKVSAHERKNFASFIWPKDFEKSNKLTKKTTSETGTSYESTR